MPRPRRAVVVGADAAGMSAAHQALRRSRARGLDLEVTVLESSGHTSYSACGIPYWIAGDVDDAQDLVARSAGKHRDMGVDLRMGATATSLDLNRRMVHYRDDQDSPGQAPFDELVLATGARAVIPPWARDAGGGLISGMHPVKNLDDGAAWLDMLGHGAAGGQPGARRAVVVGGGYVGLEMAEATVRRGLDTTLITRSEVMSSLDPDMSSRISGVLKESGIDVLTSTQVASVGTTDDGGQVSEIVTSDGRTCPADVVVLGVGIQPASELGAHAGLPVGRFGGYTPDERGQLGDGVWAVGDCCEAIHRITGRYAFVPLGTHANKQGRVVGDNLAGGNSRFGGVLGTAITRFAAGSQYAEIARTGLSTAEAVAAGLAVGSLVTEGSTIAAYMPEAEPNATEVVAEHATRRLLGVQIVGGHGAGKRIDTAAAALWGGMTVDDLAGMDLAYAPPFATVWEALQLAARRLADRLE